MVTNALNLSRLSLEFDNSPQARGKFTWDGKDVTFPIGLDAVERFSPNPLTDLSQAAKGQWVDEKTFLLEIDLVGGVNFYRMELTFSGKDVSLALSERTGLNKEKVVGSLQ